MKKQQNRYIPPLHYSRLTSLYDPLMRWFGRECVYKCRLIKQAHIEHGYKVLDAGCGTATLTILIKQSHPDATVSGLDADPQALSIAGAKVAKAGLNITLTQGSAFELPYADGSFDRVFASVMIHHLSDDNKAKMFKEVLRVLRQSGEFHIAEFGKPHNALMWLISVFMRHFEATSKLIKGLLPEMLKQAGFEQAGETDRFGTVFGTISTYRAQKG